MYESGQTLADVLRDATEAKSADNYRFFYLRQVFITDVGSTDQTSFLPWEQHELPGQYNYRILYFL